MHRGNTRMLLPDNQTQRTNDWWKWGSNSKRKSLTDYPRLERYLQHRFSESFKNLRTFPPTNVVGREHNSALVAQVFQFTLPWIAITISKRARLERAIGKSYTDQLRVLGNGSIHLPDAVISPRGHDEVVQILQVCSSHDFKVIPFGGGSNVVGAFRLKSYDRPHVVLDMSGMNRMLHFSRTNCLAIFEAGIDGPSVEEHLGKYGFTLGHFPQSFEYSTLGGWIATNSAGQESPLYGRISDMVISLKIATPSGTINTSNYESEAGGINLKSLFFGSEGMLGIVTEAQVHVHRISEKKTWMAALFPTFDSGREAIHQLVLGGLAPTVVRYTDKHETSILSLFSPDRTETGFSKMKSYAAKFVSACTGKKPGENLVLIRLDGQTKEVRTRQLEAARIFRMHQGICIGETLGKRWEASRFDLPYLRDDLLERGFLIDTMETVFPWDRIDGLKEKLLSELQGSKAFGCEKGILLTHLSHVYRTSCSVYFTVVTVQDVNDPLGQWKEIKEMVMDFIVREGGAVSHHHSVGRDHQPWYNRTTDILTKGILRRVKSELDPENILNPGKLFDE